MTRNVKVTHSRRHHRYSVLQVLRHVHFRSVPFCLGRRLPVFFFYSYIVVGQRHQDDNSENPIVNSENLPSPSTPDTHSASCSWAGKVLSSSSSVQTQNPWFPLWFFYHGPHILEFTPARHQTGTAQHFHQSKCCADSLSVCPTPVCIYTHA